MIGAETAISEKSLLAFNKQHHKSKRCGTKSVHTNGVDTNSVG